MGNTSLIQETNNTSAIKYPRL